jgi:hypothetical protein
MYWYQGICRFFLAYRYIVIVLSGYFVLHKERQIALFSYLRVPVIDRPASRYDNEGLLHSYRHITGSAANGGGSYNKRCEDKSS